MTTHTFDTPTSGDAHRPSAAVRFLHAFRHWRKGRPFPGGLLIILAGVELWLAPLSSIGTIMHEGIGGVSAFFIGILMMMFGLTVWIAPAYRVFAGIASILLGLVALPATNLGGFFLGTLLAMIGGGLAVSWTPRPGWVAMTRRERRRMRAEQESVQTGSVQTEAMQAEAAYAQAPHPEFVQTEPGHPSPLQFEVPPPEPRQLATPLEAPQEAPRPDQTPTANLPEVENTGAAERPEV